MWGERPRRVHVDGAGLRIAIARSRFNEEVTQRLLDATCETLRTSGVSDEAVTVVEVPGAFELPLVAKALAATNAYDAVITIGAVIRGETGHYELVANEAAAGISRVALDTGVPVIFGVLATEDVAQAEARSGGELGNRGEDFALAAVEMARLLRQIAGG